MYYFYRKSNQGHGICPLYRGCPPLESPLLEVSLYMYTQWRIQGWCLGCLGCLGTTLGSKDGPNFKYILQCLKNGGITTHLGSDKRKVGSDKS